MWKCDLLNATTNGHPAGSQTGDLSAQSPRRQSDKIYFTFDVVMLIMTIVSTNEHALEHISEISRV